MQKESINIMWFKRDLRVRDNAALKAAVKSSREPNDPKLLLLYIFEPELVTDVHYSDRHWRFIAESLESLDSTICRMFHFGKSELGEWPEISKSAHVENDELEPPCVYTFNRNATELFTEIFNRYNVSELFSSEETGLKITFDRDLAVQRLCRQHRVKWTEFPTNNVIRRLMDRALWMEHFKTNVSVHQQHPDLNSCRPFIPEKQWLANNRGTPPPKEWWVRDENFQRGGEDEGLAVLHSFLSDRARNYSVSVPSPLLSVEGCSRLSPYLAWGCLSIRQVQQALEVALKNPASESMHILKEYQKFAPRLKWQGQFIQQFESDDRIEFENARKSTQEIVKNDNPLQYQAWCTGHTGYPLIDACMRALIKTGYVNFRMRALLVSFLTHHLFQDWKQGAKHLASIFLDFEPGLHYAQIQMQSGMGHQQTVRVYNPVKQSYDNDEQGTFIRQWVPELENCPSEFIHEPWRMNSFAQRKFNIIIGVDYPRPIVDYVETGKHARLILYNYRKKTSK